MPSVESNRYIYRCLSCGREYPPVVFEAKYKYLCPSCGKAEDNRPLVGVMQIIYDYDRFRKKLPRREFLQLTPGRPWLYPDLWPVENMADVLPDEQKEWLALPASLLFGKTINGQELLILDDTRNPTFSFKDRASILVALKAMEEGITDISVASTGNAGSSLAGICARLGLKAHVWVPESIPPQKRLQIQSYGAAIHVVQGSYDAAFDLNRRIAKQQNWFDRNTAYNPLTIEGKKSAAYDIFIATAGKLPDCILVPVGDGVILAGLFKGFDELRQLDWIEKVPRLIGVQAAGSDALVRYVETGKFEFKAAETVADSICAGAPRNLYMAAEAIRSSEGQTIAVPDDDILAGQEDLAKNHGILVEPSAAITLAAWKSLVQKEILTSKDRCLLMFTGSGLKDMQVLQNWCPEVEARTAEKWITHFKLN